MRLRFQTLKGMEMLAEREGRLLGTVRRLQIDSKRKKAIGLVFKARGISAEQWARVASINRVGEEVVFLADARGVRDDAPTGRDVRDLLGLSVTSLDGKRLGTLQDVVLDTEDWSVASLVLDGNTEVEMGTKAVLGEDTILLQKGAVVQVRTSGSGQGGGFLSRVFNADEEEAGTKKKPIKTTAGRSTKATKRRK